MDPTRRALAHLFRRAGFGASPAELEAAARDGYTATLERLLAPERVRDDEVETRIAAAGLDQSRIEGLRQAWLLRMLHTRRPLQEKMVLFWHGHLTSAVSKVGGRRVELLARQLALFREHALGNWRALLRAISRDGAMLFYLDNRLNRRSAPNENYARELLELFTLGIGQYTEQDVKEVARAFTGWTLNRDGEFVIVARQHDDGPKTIFGRTGHWDGDDVIDLILEQPAAAPFLARKLYRFFVADDPPAATIERLAAEFRASDWDLRVLVGSILRSPEFQSEQAYRARIKSPVEFVIGTLKALGAEHLPPDTPAALRRMGQDLLNPPSVKGWDGGPSWINAATLLERANFASRLAAGRGGERAPAFVAPQAIAAQHSTPDAWVDYWVERLLDGDLPANARAALRAYAHDGVGADAAGAAERDDPADVKVRGLLHLVLASPYYQLS
ncbi:MAG: DUF1800 domain-containing protein [Chloroflexi bacterium]|nr:DUF1800 domain-containing protein [Chloroflexota bacterium]